MIRLSVTRWWLAREVRELSFDRVRGILYTYKDFGTSWGVSPFWMGRTDSVEIFSVALALSGPEEQLPLFDFFGEGSTETGLSGVILGGDSILDFRGSQSADSKYFARLLVRATGVELVSY